MEKYWRALIGGPFDGQAVEVDKGVNAIDFGTTYDGMYHRMHQPAVEPDMERWFREGSIEWSPEEIWFEWHERDWVSPHVAVIREAVREAADRHTATA